MVMMGWEGVGEGGGDGGGWGGMMGEKGRRGVIGDEGSFTAV